MHSFRNTNQLSRWAFLQPSNHIDPNHPSRQSAFRPGRWETVSRPRLKLTFVARPPDGCHWQCELPTPTLWKIWTSSVMTGHNQCSQNRCCLAFTATTIFPDPLSRKVLRLILMSTNSLVLQSPLFITFFPRRGRNMCIIDNSIVDYVTQRTKALHWWLLCAYGLNISPIKSLK
jgi:hypothetical protein